MTGINRAVRNHELAASYLERAASHHRLSAKHYQDGDHDKGAYDAYIAHACARHAMHLSDEAARLHVEEYPDTVTPG
jgi:hypothetical protein